MLSLLLAIIMLQFLKVFNAEELHNQIHLALHPWDPFFINNLNMTAKSVEEHCFVRLNVKLQAKNGF